MYPISQEQSKTSSNSMLDLSRSSNKYNTASEPIGTPSSYKSSMPVTPTSPTTNASLSSILGQNSPTFPITTSSPLSSLLANNNTSTSPTTTFMSSLSRANGFSSDRGNRSPRDESNDSEGSSEHLAAPIDHLSTSITSSKKDKSAPTALVIGDDLVNQTEVSSFS